MRNRAPEKPVGPEETPPTSSSFDPEGFVRNEDFSPSVVEENPLGDCPVRPLGTRDNTYFFISALGEIIPIRARGGFTRGEIEGLFGGDTTWLKENCKSEDSWSTPYARVVLICACHKEGIFDPRTQVRGLGVWRNRDGGNGIEGLITHCGDEVLIGGQWQRAGFKHNGAYYIASPRIGRPADKPAGIAEGNALLTGLRNWAFQDDMGAELVCGFVGQALLGEAVDWRAHLLVTAEAGSGKSTMAELIGAAMFPLAHPELTDYSKAGLEQTFTGEARPFVLDEAENRADGRIQAVIELIRQLSGSGAKGVRGSSGGQSRAFDVNGAAFLCSIVAAPLSPQDASRIVHLDLGKPTGKPKTEYFRDLQRDIRKMAPAIWSRVLNNFDRYSDSLAHWRKAIIDADGSQREADTYGALLAGRDLLITDELPDHELVSITMERLKPLLERARQATVEESEGNQCLSHLLGSHIRVSGTDHRSVSGIISEVRGKEHPALDLMRALQEHGLKYLPKEDMLVVANKHPMLDQIYKDTRWGKSAWAKVLPYLDGAGSRDCLRFSGLASRGVGIPKSHLPSTETGNND